MYTTPIYAPYNLSILNIARRLHEEIKRQRLPWLIHQARVAENQVFQKNQPPEDEDDNQRAPRVSYPPENQNAIPLKTEAERPQP
jgi:hypothetical protein